MKTKIAILALFASIGLMGQTKIKISQLQNPATSSLNLGTQTFSVGNINSNGNLSIDQSGGINSVSPKKFSFQPYTAATSLPALYFSQNIPSSTNYFALADSLNHIVNAPTDLYLRAKNISFMQGSIPTGSTAVTITFPATSQATINNNVELRHFIFNGNTLGLPSGSSVSLFRENLWTAPTYSGNGAATITNAVANTWNKATIGANLTVSNNNWAGEFIGDLNVTTKAYIGGALVLPTAKLHIAGGSASAATAPLKYTSGTLMTSAEAGAVEYDGKVFYQTTEDNNRGLAPSVYYMRANTDYTLSNVATIQQLFGSTANGRITLPVGVYEFELLFRVTSMSANSGNATFTWGGTATASSYLFYNIGVDTAPTTGPSTPNGGMQIINATPVNMVTAGTSTMLWANLRGTFKVTVAGTMIPQITLTDAAAAILTTGSYVKITCLGGTSATYVGNWD